MANFTTDFLRGALASSNIGGTPESYFLYEDGVEHIQVNSPFFSPTHELKTGWSDRGSNHFILIHHIIMIYIYVHKLLNHDINGADINNTSSSWSIRNNVITDVSFVNLLVIQMFQQLQHLIILNNYFGLAYIHTAILNIVLQILILILQKKLYLGNYLNVNEVEALNQQILVEIICIQIKMLTICPKKHLLVFIHVDV